MKLRVNGSNEGSILTGRTKTCVVLREQLGLAGLATVVVLVSVVPVLFMWTARWWPVVWCR